MRRAVVLIALALSACAAKEFRGIHFQSEESIKDEPYLQYLSNKYAFPTSKLPFDAADEVLQSARSLKLVQMQPYGGAGTGPYDAAAFILASNALYVQPLDVDAKRGSVSKEVYFGGSGLSSTAVRVDQDLELALEGDNTLLAASSSGSLLVVSGSFITEVAIAVTPSLEQSAAHAALGFSPRHPVATVRRGSMQGRDIALAVVRTIPAPLGTITCAASASKGGSGTDRLVVGTQDGVFHVEWPSSPKLMDAAPEVSRDSRINGTVFAIAADDDGTFAASTEEKLFKCGESGSCIWEWSVNSNGDPDESQRVRALAFDRTNTVWAVSDAAVHAWVPDGALHRMDGYKGLPALNNTLVSAVRIPSGELRSAVGGDKDRDHGYVFFASPTGISITQGAPESDVNSDDGLEKSHYGPWRYMSGPRWMAGSDVSLMDTCIGPDGLPMVLAVTESGLTHLWGEWWTLERKASHMQSIVPRHYRYGLTADCSLNALGNVTSCSTHPTDNDGLWTSLFVVSQSMRYAVTRDPEAKKAAWKSFEAMEFLSNVTGISGFMARSFDRADRAHGGGRWFNSTVYPGWAFKGDTSSDEVTGHFFAHPMVLDLVAETAEERARPLRLIRDIASYILENKFYLIGVDGRPTTWGRWAPEVLNNDPKWFDERGLNALQILTWMLIAHKYTGEQRFLDAFNDLAVTHGYDYNIINQKITLPGDDNFSDDELAFLPYYGLFRVSTGEHASWAAEGSARVSVDRAWDIIHTSRPSLWDFVYGSAGGEEKRDLREAVWDLRRWPVSCVDWPFDNSQRADIITSKYKNRGGNSFSLRVLPPDERDSGRWNSDPFTLSGGSGTTELDPGAFLLPYWMARYHKFVVA